MPSFPHSQSKRLVASGRFLLLTVLLLPATYPLWRPGMPTTHDAIHHIARLFELDTLIRAGVWYPRWFPDMGFLYGFPVLHYYGAFIYYLAEGFRLLGAGYIASQEWVLGLGLIASGWTMYGFARRWSESVAWLAALAYVYWPYHLADAHVRGAQAELWALVWSPVLLARTHRLFHDDDKGRWRGALLLALFLALLLLTHNISAVMITSVLILYALWLAREQRRRRTLLAFAAALALGLSLSAFFWAPALADMGWVRAHELSVAAAAEYANRLFPLTGLFSPFWLHRYLPEQGAAIFHPFPRVAFLLWLTGLALMLLRWRHSPRAWRRPWLFFVLLTLVSAWMMHSSSRFLWERVTSFALLGPPYRFQSLVTLAGSLTFALGFDAGVKRLLQEREEKSRVHPLLPYALYAAVLVLLPLSSLPRLPQTTMTVPGSEQVLTDADMHRQTIVQFDYQIGLTAREWGSAWFYEYLPVWITESATDFFLPPEKPPSPQPPLDIDLALESYTPLHQTYRVSGFVPWTFSLHQFYFPTWQILMDGRQVKTYPRGNLGLLAADIPAGEHRLEVRFGRSSAERIAALLSVAALLLWLWLAARRFPRMFATMLILALMGIVLILTLSPPHLNATPTLQPQNVRVGEEIQLLASTLSTTEAKPGDRVWVALDWLALAPPQERYKVLMHLEDEEGKMWANGDAEPGFFFTPTTRWQAGEVMRDWESIVIPEDIPPGAYRLLTGMYRPETLENLPLQGGKQLDGRLLLGEITVLP